jgi:beta-carotene hydroxylase
MTNADGFERQAVATASKYMGVVAWPTVILGLLFSAIYLTAVGLALAGLISLWIAVPVVAVVNYLSYTILHESVHGSIGGNNRSMRCLNKVLGYVAAWITMIPLTAHRYEHIAHHRHTNDANRDPDFHMGRMWDSPVAPVRAALQAWTSQFAYYAKYRWANAPPRQNLALCLEVFAAIVPRLVVVVAGYWVEGLALFVFAWVLGAIILVYLFAYVVHRPHTEIGRYRDTATILPPGPGALKTLLNWAWMFQNYHSIHHLFPRVPFYKYGELHDEIQDVMEARQAPIYSISLRGMKPITPKLAAR